MPATARALTLALWKPRTPINSEGRVWLMIASTYEGLPAYWPLRGGLCTATPVPSVPFLDPSSAAAGCAALALSLSLRASAAPARAAAAADVCIRRLELQTEP